MSGFHEVRFPLRLALGVTGGPVRRTDIVTLSNGREQRNARWRSSRRAYDAGSGVKSLSDLYEVLAFFEARAGELYGFRFRDPLDWKSSAPGAVITSADQVIGTGDGETATFALTKTYADVAAGSVRTIAKPVAGTVTVSVNGVTKAVSAFSCDATTGIVAFAVGHVPAAGAVVRAGYEFDVPVRFATDRIEVNLSNFNAGSIPAIPITEILP